MPHKFHLHLKVLLQKWKWIDGEEVKRIVYSNLEAISNIGRTWFQICICHNWLVDVVGKTEPKACQFFWSCTNLEKIEKNKKIYKKRN